MFIGGVLPGLIRTAYLTSRASGVIIRGEWGGERLALLNGSTVLMHVCLILLRKFIKLYFTPCGEFEEFGDRGPWS